MASDMQLGAFGLPWRPGLGLKLDCVGFAPEDVPLMILLWGSSMVLLTAAQNSFLSYPGSPTSVVMCVCMCIQSCLTLHNPIDCSLSSSSVYGILQARILERVVMSCSRGSSWLRDQTWISCVSFIGRQILYHWATSEALLWNFRRLIFSFFFYYFSFLFSLSGFFH